MFTDGGKLPGTFESWSKSAAELYDRLTGQGHVVVKAYIDRDAFPDWCRANGLEMNAKARTRFGNECAAEHSKAEAQ
jgi:hypothetical protein